METFSSIPVAFLPQLIVSKRGWLAGLKPKRISGSRNINGSKLKLKVEATSKFCSRIKGIQRFVSRIWEHWLCLQISVACFLPFLSTYRFLYFAISFISLILLFHSVTLAFCFPFSLNHPLVVLFLLSRPISPFPASPVLPDVGQKFKKSQLQCKLLTHWCHYDIW